MDKDEIIMLKKTLISFCAISCFFLCTICIFYNPNLNAKNIRTVNKFDTIKDLINLPSDKTIIFFDIDDVIITPKDNILKSCKGKNPFKLIRYLHKGISSENSSELKNFFLERLGTLYSARQVKLSEPKLGDFINSLIKRGYTVVGITGINIGGCGRISNVEEWRIAELKSLGINFRPRFFSCNDEEIHTCKCHSGVIFIGDKKKSYCITKLIEKLPYFHNIVFIDDQKLNLEQADKVLSNMGLKFIGFHYVGAKNAPCNLDRKMAVFQWTHLMEYNIWISDKEAEESR